MFQVIGLDVMLDSDHQPWVLEVNGRPSLSGHQELIKQDLLRATLRLLLARIRTQPANPDRDSDGSAATNGQREGEGGGAALVSLALE